MDKPYPDDRKQDMAAIGAAIDFYVAVTGKYPTAKQIQALFAFMGIDVELEHIESKKAILQELARAEMIGLSQSGRTIHD